MSSWILFGHSAAAWELIIKSVHALNWLACKGSKKWYTRSFPLRKQQDPVIDLPKPYPNLVKELAVFLEVWFWVTIAVGEALWKCKMLAWGSGHLGSESPGPGPPAPGSVFKPISPGDPEHSGGCGSGRCGPGQGSRVPRARLSPSGRLSRLLEQELWCSVTDVPCSLTW